MAISKDLSIKYIRAKFRLLSSISKRKAAEEAFKLFVTPQQRNKKTLPAAFVKAETIDTLFEKTHIKGYRWNHPSEKKLLILHGFESSVVNFDHFINPLLKKGYEILAFDAPAHGLSGGKSVHAVDYKNFIHFINEQYGPITNFITHSFGGLAISLALEEIPHDASYKVVLVAPATESVTAMNLFFKFLKLDDEVRKEFNEFITQANNKPPEWYSVARAADNIKAQVLFLQDKKDDLTPISDVEPIMKKKLPNFHFIISEGLGHRRIYKDPQSVKSIIDFF